MEPGWVCRIFRDWAVCCAGLLAVGGQPAAAAPQVPTAGGARLDQLPQQWRDDRGDRLPLASLVGHRVILTMAYATCHKFCPATISNLGRLQQALDARGEQVDFVIVGYDPDSDGPATWHRYRAHRHLNRSNWHFLTGTPDATAQLARQLGFEFWKYDDHVMHDVRVVVFDAHGVLANAIGSGTRDWSAVL